MTSRLLLIALLAGASTLSACGKQGALERPAPLFGAEAKTQYAKEQAAKEKKGADGNAQPNASGEENAGDETDVVNPPGYNPQDTPLPPRTAPITGQPSDPFSSRSQGAIPDPYTNPNRSQ